MSTRKILSSDKKSVFGVAVSDKTIEIRRLGQVFTITGTDYTLVGTPSMGKKATIISIKKGKIDENIVSFATDEQLAQLKKEREDKRDEENGKKEKSDDDKKDDKKDDINDADNDKGDKSDPKSDKKDK